MNTVIILTSSLLLIAIVIFFYIRRRNKKIRLTSKRHRIKERNLKNKLHEAKHLSNNSSPS